MKSSRPILLVIDNRIRDGLDYLLIYYWLRLMGCKVILCNNRNWKDHWRARKPSVVTVPYTDGGRQELLSHVAKISNVVMLPSEGAIPIRDYVINERYTSRISGSGGYFREVSKVFAWGSQTAEWLLEADVFKPEQMMVAGSARLDPYMVLPKSASFSEKNEDMVGIASNFGQLNVYHRETPMQLIDSRRNVDKDVYYAADRNIEDFIWYYSASIRSVFDLLEANNIAEGGPVYLRPGPFEFVEGYNFLKKKYPELIVSNRLRVWEFITSISCLVTHNSSIGIEALIAGVPVISLKKLLGPREKDHMDVPIFTGTPFADFYIQPASLSETIELLVAARKGQLKASGGTPEFKDYMKRFYDWPRHEPSSLTIARELAILADMSDGKVKKVDPMPRISDKEGIPKPILNIYRKVGNHLPPFTIDLGYVLFDLLNGHFRAMQRYRFYSWHRKDYVDTKKVWDRLKRDYA